MSFSAVSWPDLISHLFQALLIGRINVLVSISVNGIFVRFFMRQEVSSIATLCHTSVNHLRWNHLAVVNPSDLCKEVNQDGAEVVVTNVTELPRTIVVWKDVMIVVITKIKWELFNDYNWLEQRAHTHPSPNEKKTIARLSVALWPLSYERENRCKILSITSLFLSLPLS